MNKDKYFSQLESLLQRLSQEDRKELLYDLHEYFETGLEAGKTEEEIIEELGDPETIAKEMLADQHPLQHQKGPLPPVIITKKKKLPFYITLSAIVIFFLVITVSTLTGLLLVSAPEKSIQTLQSQQEPFISLDGIEEFINDSVDPYVNGFDYDKYSYYSSSEYMDSIEDMIDTSVNSVQQFTDQFKDFPIESYDEVDSATIDVFREETIQNKDIENIKISTVISNIDIVTSEKDEVNIVLNGKISENIEEYLLFDVQSQGDTITVKVSLNFQNIRNIIANLNLQVSIPKDYNYENIELSSISGETKIDGLLTNALSLQSTSGNIDLKNSTTEQIKINSTAGNINLDDSTTKQTGINVTSGNINMDNVTAENYIFSTISGSVQMIDDTLTGNVKATTTSGDVQLDIEKTIPSVNINFGSITGEAKLDIDELIYETKKEHKIIAKKEEGLYEIQVNTTTGDFTLFNTQASTAN
ncbi:DUF4097 family beta strand repeat-containing protein [Longirhabdus pacifica]|uniref:DUF4097 family beta strand repeat-containing protein n=1 Tax=Longirhabdus pacifica TaxID=2305227 RepID=UPI001008DB59|nr:DUF4097 family beta strand repeat-containing protein [Longirhabdus pacifica]